MKLKYAALLSIVALGLAACAGDEGPAGPAGEMGATGEAGPAGPAGMDGAAGADGMDGMDAVAPFTLTGTVSGPSGPAANAVVVIQAVTADGEVFSTAGFTKADENGAYELAILNVTAADTYLLVSASTDEGVFNAHVTGEVQDVSVQTDAAAQIIGKIVATPGGRFVNDFTTTEVADSVADVTAALTAAGTDLSDADAVYTAALEGAGEAIADRSGGEIVLGAGNPITTEPADVQVAATLPTDITDGNGEIWDLQPDGEVGDGTDDAYDTFFEMTINGTRFVTSQEPIFLEDGNEYVIGPIVDFDGTGLDIFRKIYIDTDGLGYTRFSHVITNTTAAAVTFDFQIGGNLGSDENNVFVGASSSGDDLLDATDSWLTNAQDVDDPAVGFIFPGVTRAEKSDDDIDFFWDAVTIEPGETLIINVWGMQRTGESAELAADSLRILFGSPELLFAGMSSAEFGNIYGAQFSNVRGDAGSVAPGAPITVENATSGTTASALAGPDGSFALGIPFSTGDMINVTTPWGRNDMFTAP